MHAPRTRQIHRPTVVASVGAPPAPARELTRRVFLRRFSVGAGAVIVVASGGLTWRAVDQGVFAPGTGPAYEPWHIDLSSGGPMSLVSAAILAANAHDSQPWAFRVAPERIDAHRSVIPCSRRVGDRRQVEPSPSYTLIGPTELQRQL